MFIMVVNGGPSCPEPTPMADTDKERLITWARTFARGHTFTIWEQNGVNIRLLSRHQPIAA